jgi:hypothetical protein
MISKGFVGVFDAPLDDAAIRKCVSSWIARFEQVEQVCPGGGGSALTITLGSADELIADPHLQFRILLGQDFSWVYVTRNGRVMETSGLPIEEVTLTLDVLLELPGLVEVVDQHNDRRLDQLEAEGLM